MEESSSVSVDVKDDFFDESREGHNDMILVIVDTTTTSRRRRRRRRAVLCYISILAAVAVGFACSISLFMSPHYDSNPVVHQQQSLLLRNNNNNSSNRRLQRRGDPTSNPYEVENNNNSNNGVGGWFGKGKNNDNDASTTAAAAAASPNTGSYNSAYGSTTAGSSSNAYGTYGSYNGAATGSSSGTTGGNTHGYGTSSGNTNNGYGSYGSSSYGGTSAYGSSSSSSSPGTSSSYSSRWGGTGSTATSSSRQWGAYNNNSRGGHSNAVKIDLFKGIFFLLLISTGGMLLTAHSMENDPEGTFANCCRVSLHTVNCVYSIIYNLYHCRLGEIPAIICGANNLEEDEYTDEELERMNLRPGIERALDVEHRKALRKVGVEMNMIKTSSKNGSNSKKNGASVGSGKSNKSQNGGTSIQR